MKYTEMHAAAQEACNLMKALANERRLLLLCQLVEGEKSVGALAEALGLGQAIISQQLALLRKDGLVDFRREGQSVFYSLSNPAARRILEVLYETYCPDNAVAG